MKKALSLMLIVICFCGCQDKSPKQAKTEAKRPPAAMTPAPPHISVTGAVLEKIDVTGGMYLRLKTPQGEVWTAVDKADVKKGAEVTVLNAVPMDGFESKSLKRKFDHILFGSLAAGQMASDSKKEPTAKMHPAVANLSAEQEAIKVKKAEGAEGKTVAEIFAAKSTLKGAPVALRGKVVKCNMGIMGKNWLHLRDGSGSPEKQNFDMTVTTLDTAAVGDTVLIKGKVSLDRDFGAGYVYPIIIEDAKVTK